MMNSSSNFVLLKSLFTSDSSACSTVTELNVQFARSLSFCPFVRSTRAMFIIRLPHSWFWLRLSLFLFEFNASIAFYLYFLIGWIISTIFIVIATKYSHSLINVSE